jgi:hypothetical protein
MDDESLASRLVTYADASAAVFFVGAAGLSNAIMDANTHCSLANAFREVSVGIVSFASIISFTQITLRRWELDLLEGARVSKKAEMYSRRLHVARLAIVWLSAILVLSFILLLQGDPACTG